MTTELTTTYQNTETGVLVTKMATRVNSTGEPVSVSISTCFIPGEYNIPNTDGFYTLEEVSDDNHSNNI